MPSFNPFRQNCRGKGKTNQPTRTLREFAALKNMTTIQMRTMWDYSPVDKPEPQFKVAGKSNKHYYVLSDLEAWFELDRSARKHTTL